MQLLGYDIGSSSIKASIVDAESGLQIAFAQSPEKELTIQSPRKGWAEQDPNVWWKHVKATTARLLDSDNVQKEAIAAIGISYQMHGLVIVDENKEVLRPSIIWCDGRAVDSGSEITEELGEAYSLSHLLNKPGNFTASKLKWVKEHEPDLFQKIFKFMLPGDFIAMKMTGQINTSVSGLSEAILWDYKKHGLATEVMHAAGIPENVVPEIFTNFGQHGKLSERAADELGLPSGILLSYRAGDQPNNALSLNAMDPGEIASTAGTSGVIYGVTDKPLYDKQSRVNTFVHVNHNEDLQRYGVLLCINGTGIQNSWLKNEVFNSELDYRAMNERAESVAVGSDGLSIIPFGNGPERILQDTDTGAYIGKINFNRHRRAHITRAAHEGIAFSLCHGLDIMQEMGISIESIRAASSNMFQSRVFRETLCNCANVPLDLYETNGALGAAIGAGIGAGIFSDREEAFKGLQKKGSVDPDPKQRDEYLRAFDEWQLTLKKILETEA
ncbi:carbohydrate kinase [Balneolaceae bacterium YR4-1]|uniref:Carbohydrate kinase n=1 Tax=Halalkalibaculum roseum TaxID=2709311 RepID=A0A6M1SXA7_9BACT|nr:FGGY family carbohydrate kinase [Halalkalibaculum roseum]NGP76626.1 carbohydrate kinase [Halalkalibaculum roseum]